jgi:tetratricopeptide (TPR) repeat protein
MVVANRMRSERRSLLVRGLTLGVLMGACWASARPTQAQHSAVDYYKQGNVWSEKKEFDRAIADYDQAIKLDPNYVDAYNNRGLAWNEKKEYDRAIADLDRAIKLDAKYTKAYYNRGVSWNGKGEYDRAIADYNQAIKLAPKYTKAYSNRGFAWRNKKQYDRAIADYNQALEIDPQFIQAYGNLAWLQATCPDARFRDGPKAFENANRAYQLSGGKDAAYIDTLAGAYAENGDFEKAKQWQAKAIDLLTDEKEKAAFRSRLRLYEQEKPYRTEPQPR